MDHRITTSSCGLIAVIMQGRDSSPKPDTVFKIRVCPQKGISASFPFLHASGFWAACTRILIPLVYLGKEEMSEWENPTIETRISLVE